MDKEEKIITPNNPDVTGNISKKRREELIGKIEEIRSFLESSGDANARHLVAFASELEKEIRHKKYGLVFEEHKERIDIELEKNLPVLTEIKERFIDNGGDVNFLIEGDNLAALKLLEKTHRGKIDVIYIDPPYNTGNNDFIYNDSYVDKDDMFKHSKWLSFMEKRLKSANLLLSKNGVIFISIDDNELSSLKSLSDSIFGETNFGGILPRVTKRSGKDHSHLVGLNHDYILFYSKDKTFTQFKRDEAEAEKYNERDEFYNERGPYKLNQTLDYDSLWYNPAMDFPININGEIFYPGGEKMNYDKRHSGIHEPKDWVWRWSLEKFKFGLANGFIVIKKGKGRKRIYTKTYLNAKIDKKGKSYYIKSVSREQIISSLAFVENIFSNDNAKKELGMVLNKNSFDFPKPSTLVNKLVDISSFNNSTILDFFAGSGTTGHAVMKLNANSEGNRKFILVTNNENGICENVTYERLRRVIEKENYRARLKYFKIEMLPIEEKLYYEYADDLLKHIRELVELENAVDFSHDNSVAIILTEDELADFFNSSERISACKSVYIGQDVLLNSKNKDKIMRHNILLKRIPKYYYPEKEG